MGCSGCRSCRRGWHRRPGQGRCLRPARTPPSRRRAATHSRAGTPSASGRSMPPSAAARPARRDRARHSPGRSPPGAAARSARTGIRGEASPRRPRRISAGRHSRAPGARSKAPDRSGGRSDRGHAGPGRCRAGFRRPRTATGSAARCAAPAASREARDRQHRRRWVGGCSCARGPRLLRPPAGELRRSPGERSRSSICRLYTGLRE